MKGFLEKISAELTKKISDFEKKNGKIEDFYNKQINFPEHKLILENIFLHPDIECLEKYEKELNGNN